MSNVITEPSLETTVRRWQGELIGPSHAQWPRLNAHNTCWMNAIENGLQHELWLIEAKLDGRITGTLPLALVSGPIFGRFLVGLPYVNTGGVWANSEDAAYQMITAACELADRLDVKYFELRHEIPVSHPKFNFQRTDKVHMRLQLPQSSDVLKSELKSKVRSQVKKSHQFDSTISFGQQDHLNDFYNVFATNMRDLGTPVFPRKLFSAILKAFDGDAEIGVVRNCGRAVAAAILVHADNITEVPSASCLRKFNHTNANMFMYWNLLERAIQRQSQTFDFGRSSKDSGTYRFKAQWGATPETAVWQYYVRHGDPSEMQASSGSKQKLVNVWKKLPVWLTRLAGPFIVKGIP